MTCESTHQMSISHQHGSGYRRRCARDRVSSGRLYTPVKILPYWVQFAVSGSLSAAVAAAIGLAAGGHDGIVV